MSVKRVTEGLYQIGLGAVNVFLLEALNGPYRGELTLVDAGYPGSAGRILKAVRELGREPSEVRRIIITHCHADHGGGLSELKKATGAEACAHPEDAALIRRGQGIRTLTPGPRLVGRIVFALFVARAPTTYEAAEVEHELADGEEPDWLGGARVIHAPGHCKGQICLLWPRGGGALIAADAASNIFGLDFMICHEDFPLAARTLSRLSELSFEHAVFGHGGAIVGGASQRFRRKFAG